MECVGGLSPVSTNLPYASQAQGLGAPCFPRGAEQTQAFPWGDLEFPLHLYLSMVSPLGKLPNPLVFRVDFTTEQVRAAVRGLVGRTRALGVIRELPQWVLGAFPLYFVGTWGRGDLRKRGGWGKKGWRLPATSWLRFWAMEIAGRVGAGLVFRFWSEKWRFNPASPAYPK